jgi:deoxyribose-phosphate aldolase
MNLAAYIDHTLLNPATSEEQIKQLCEEAKEYGFAAVCVPPNKVAAAKSFLKGSSVGLATVIGFPNGYNTTSTKLFETEEALKFGATEIDMVINWGALKEGKDQEILEELFSFTAVCIEYEAVLKVIVESGMLTADELERVINLCAEANVDFVKTSTGFAAKGADLESVKTMRRLLPEHIQIKASGGIRDRESAEAYIAAGASRIGTSSGVTIIKK